MAVYPLPRRRPMAAFAALAVMLSLWSPASPALAASSIGSLDPAFGTGGRLKLGSDTPGMEFPPVVLPDGRFRLIESTTGGGTVLLGFTAGGAPDDAFGNHGVVSFAAGTHPSAMALDASGNIVLTGTITTATGVDEVILRRLPG